MSGRSYSARVMKFRRGVYANRRNISAGCQVLLLRLSDDMNPNAIVSVPRTRHTAEYHAAELFNSGGECFHHVEVVVSDPTGIQRPLTEPRMCSPIELSLTTTTAPDGHEVEAPHFHLDADGEHSLDQMVALADAIREMVQQYRTAGGVA
jgi:hypothetical protein